MHALNFCYVLKYLWVDIKEDVDIMFKIISQTPALPSSMAAYSEGTQNLLATNYCDLEDRPRLSIKLQLQNHLHLGCKHTDHKICTTPCKSLDGLQQSGQLRLHLAHFACTKCSSHSHSFSET